MSNTPSSTTVSGGIGFFGLLTIVLIVLKILGHIQTGWLAIIFLPIYGPICLFLVIMVFGFIFAFGALCIAALIDKFS